MEAGHAYYAFDTPEELDKLRNDYESRGATFVYDAGVRESLNNSLAMTASQVEQEIESGTPYVIRFKFVPEKEIVMEDSVYKIVEVVGFSETSWEDAAKVAVAAVDKSIRDMRIAEVVMMDMRLEDNRIVGYRTKLKVSFKME